MTAIGVMGSPVRSEDVGDVVFAAAGADVAGEDALVLVAGGGGDLGGVMAVAGRLGGVPGAQRVSGELARVKSGGAGALLDDQGDGLRGEGVADRAGPGHAPEDRAGGERGRVDPGAESADRAGPRRLGVDDQQLLAAALLVGLERAIRIRRPVCADNRLSQRPFERRRGCSGEFRPEAGENDWNAPSRKCEVRKCESARFAGNFT
jgi:hypothetical protein